MPWTRLNNRFFLDFIFYALNLELLETVDKVLFGVNVTYNCSTVDKKVLLLPIH
jgi:hypothetical protein